MNTLAIEKMSTIERLQAMEALWDALLRESEEVKTPDWHYHVIEERKKRITDGTAEYITLQKIKARHNS
jgi:hypothetical protein